MAEKIQAILEMANKLVEEAKITTDPEYFKNKVQDAVSQAGLELKDLDRPGVSVGQALTGAVISPAFAGADPLRRNEEVIRLLSPYLTAGEMEKIVLMPFTPEEWVLVGEVLRKPWDDALAEGSSQEELDQEDYLSMDCIF
jgi:acid stress-induced BolA-like protein IbaG/YrbA